MMIYFKINFFTLYTVITPFIMYDSIYLLQTRESLHKYDDVFKVGRTSQDELKRFNNYPKGSKLHLHISCFDGVNVESKIIKAFSEKYSCAEIYGKEYFHGNLCDMIKDILHIIGLNFDSVLDNTKLCKMFKEKDDTIEALKRLSEDLQQQNDKLRQLCTHLQQRCNTLQVDIHRSKSLSDNIEKLNDECDKEDEFNDVSTGISIDEKIASDVTTKDKDHKQLVCDKCNKEFVSLRNLKLHKKQYCKGVGVLQCEICLKSFARYNGKYKHKRFVSCQPPPPPPPSLPDSEPPENNTMTTKGSLKKQCINLLQLL